MGNFIVEGGNSLSGDICISGAKNSALPILCASILCKEVTLHSCPQLSDTYNTIKILEKLGCKAKFENNTINIQTNGLNSYTIDEKIGEQMRSSIIFLGALLSRTKKAVISLPGGCKLGKRPIDIHLEALKKLGVSIIEENGTLYCNGENMTGCEITLPFPSVGATENIILAGLGARGKTIIRNPAKEPEITDLQCFLNNIGANVQGCGTDKIIIYPCDSFKDLCEYKIMPDRIEAGTYITACAITGGELFINNIIPQHLEALTDILENMGCIIKQNSCSLYIEAPKKLTAPQSISTAPYPYFPTDLQPQITALCTLAKGSCTITENIFEARYRHIPQLISMGAKIDMISNTKFIIYGTSCLYGTRVEATDLRCGAALILAGLGAKGKTIISNSHFINRGYENICEKLNLIGGNIIYKP